MVSRLGVREDVSDRRLPGTETRRWSPRHQPGCKDLEKMKGHRVPVIIDRTRLVGKYRRRAVNTMSLNISIVAMVVAAVNFVSPEVSYFPDSYFEARAKPTLQRRAMEKWPGPAQLVEMWQAGEFNGREKMAVLLGASAWHDPILLPLYRESITSSNARMRMVAAYGYRDLLADGLPDVAAGVDLVSAKRLAAEMDAVAETLRTRPLVEFWLQAALAADGGSMPGWRGVVLKRGRGASLRAVEQILDFEDFSYLTTAYRAAERTDTRLGLLRLLEAVTLQEFLVIPAGDRATWGPKNMDEALKALDAFLALWVDHRCTIDPEPILEASAAALGARGVNPLAPNSYHFWSLMLKQGTAPQRVMAARRLYQLGGRWSNLSIFQSGSPQQVAAVDEILSWYLGVPAHLLNRRAKVPTAIPQ